MKTLRSLLAAASLLLTMTPAHAATGVKVSALPTTNTVSLTDLIYLVSGSTSWAVTASNLLQSVKVFADFPAAITNNDTRTLTLAKLTNQVSLHYSRDTWLVPTNNSLSNIVVNFAHTNSVDLYTTNNLTFTNWAGLLTGVESRKTIIIRPQLITRGINWGNLGLSNPGYGVAIATNAQNPLWLTVTSGVAYAVSFVANGTNIFPTITAWQ
jgi:hypothetical protein